MELKKCIKCGVVYPKPALTKKGVCFMCEPPRNEYGMQKEVPQND